MVFDFSSYDFSSFCFSQTNDGAFNNSSVLQCFVLCKSIKYNWAFYWWTLSLHLFVFSDSHHLVFCVKKFLSFYHNNVGKTEIPEDFSQTCTTFWQSKCMSCKLALYFRENFISN